MADTTLTFRVDEDLKAAFERTAKSQDRSAAQLLRVLMQEAVEGHASAQDHDSWFREQVANALREADDPAARWISGDDMKAEWERRRAELLGREDSSLR